jgi:phosphoglycolate phosphatase
MVLDKARLKAILFDKDGTFVDFDQTWGPATLRVMQTMSRGDVAVLQRLIDLTHFDLQTTRFKHSSPLYAFSSADYGPDWAQAMGVPFSKAVTDEMDRLFAEEAIANLTPIGDPAAVFRALHMRGLVLGVITNDSEIGGVSQVQALGLQPYCSFIAGWDSGHGRKPGPGQIQAFLRNNSFKPSEVIMVGDTLHDLHAAKAAGVFALGVTSGPMVPQGFAEVADHILPSIEEIEVWLSA